MTEKTELDKTEAGGETNADVNEAQIAVHWKEEEFYHPTAKFVSQANLTDPSVPSDSTSINFRNASKNMPTC